MREMARSVLALGRQFGSGGREIGQKLSAALDIPCYDRELIQMAAERAEVREERFAGKEEKASNRWLFTGVYEGGPRVQWGAPAEDILFEMESQVILELAQKGPCIIVGRCADYVLRTAGIPVRSLFVCAPLNWRIQRRMQLDQVTEKETRDRVLKMDKQRRRYYDTYTNGRWGVPENYDACLNSAVFGIDATVDLLLHIFRSQE